MNKDQAIKIHLVALAEYLQCTLTDPQVLMYAKELSMDPDQLAFAIALLKEDAEVWPGKFPLPGKIKSYLTGNIEQQANTIVVNIMTAIDNGTHWTKLGPIEQEVVKVYGWVNLSGMMIGQRPNFITNMRAMAITILTRNKNEAMLIQHKEQHGITWEHP